MLTKTAILICVAAATALCAADPKQEILTLERQGMEGWLKGDPDPFLAISDPDITYIHVMTGKRLDGLPAVRALYETYRGRPLFDTYEITDPKVQLSGDTAILTYHFVSHNGSAERHWNATQIYQRKKEGWRIIHTHWSQVASAQP
jgi:ketosteroid isomerase-like protein